ncbi:uncharacterized protein [Eurosta solidaginis]|uniref:uncharacterized protein n=1 Tax=Eurosta solidaginis TaxID=178769 RepID=UPI003530AE29
MYIPNKPAKYGINIVLVCDVRSKYMIDASPYLGKNTGITINEPLGSYYCKLLTKTIDGTNRNLTSDNWFTSIPLAEQLLKPPYNLTLIGTIRNNKQEIPAEFKHNSLRGVGTSLFGFHEKLTLVSYKPKPQKTVLLLSTMHDKPSVDPVSGKPVIIQSYNETKGAVDTFDQMCGHSSCSRKTKRWPLCMFYGMLNMALLNSYIIYVSNCEIMKTKPMTRREFLKKLSKDLCKDWCAIRLEERPLMQKRVRAAINESIGHNTDDDTDEPGIKKGKRSRCDFCDPKLKLSIILKQDYHLGESPKDQFLVMCMPAPVGIETSEQSISEAWKIKPPYSSGVDQHRFTFSYRGGADSAATGTCVCGARGPHEAFTTVKGTNTISIYEKEKKATALGKF